MTSTLDDLHEQLRPFYSDIGRTSTGPELMIGWLLQWPSLPSGGLVVKKPAGEPVVPSVISDGGSTKRAR